MRRLLSITAIIWAGLCLNAPLVYSENEETPDPSEEIGEIVTPQELTGITASPYSAVFDGNTHTATITLSGDAEDATLLYGESEGEYTLSSIPTYTNAGTYTIYFKASKEGFVDYTNSVTVSISAQPLSITATAKSKHIGFEDPTLEYEVLGEVTGYAVTDISITRTAGETVGEYDIQINVNKEKNLNYDITTTNAKFTIEDHTLSETFTILKAATCGEDGSKAKACTYTGCDAWGETTIIPATETHQYDEKITIKQKSCTEDGLFQRKCSVCGSTKDVIDPAQGHLYDEEYTIDLQATCTNDGEKSIHCLNCADRKDITVIQAPGHAWDEGTVQSKATCTEEGTLLYACQHCEETKSETIEKLGHDFDDEYTIDLAVGCTTNGTKSQHCKRENCEVKQNITEITATGHQWGTPTVTIAPTCTETGEEKYICEKCTEEKKEIIAATGHDFSESFTIDLNPTCITTGKQSKHCQHTGCSETDEETVIAALGHQLESKGVQLEPTCEKEGEELFACTKCTYTETHPIAAIGHEYAETFTVDKVATCLEDGSESRHCIHTNCTETIGDRVIPHGEHLWTNEEILTEPSCLKDGKKRLTCQACGTKIEQAIDKLGHNYAEEFTVDTEAGCEKLGTKSRHCTRCSSKIETTFIPAKGHTDGATKRENIVEATCTEAGHYNNVLYCAVCETAISSTEKSIEPTGHTYEKATDYITKPTCEGEGLSHSICIHCGDIKTEVVAALGHDFETEYTVDKAPSCTELGLSSKHCSRCDAKIEPQTIASLGHQWNVGETTTEPTCTTLGILTQTCERCAVTQAIEIDSLGHEFSTDYTLDREATCLKEGSQSHHCNRCDAKRDSVSIPMLAHQPGVLEKADIHPATCTTDGSYKEVIACQICGTFLEETQKVGDAATGHAWDNGTQSVAPTCTESGKKTFICTLCGGVDIQDIEPLGHAYADTFSIDTLATCVLQGSQSKHCTRCDAHGESVAIPAIGHITWKSVKENIVEPKCTLQGSYDSVTYCAVCNVLLGRETITVDSTGHNWNASIETKIATCTERGVISRTCKTCMFTQTAVQEALGHDISDTFTIDQPALCEVEGVQSKHCSRCDYQDEISVIPAIGHQLSKPDTTLAPTCTMAGEKEERCTLCDYSLTSRIRATGHQFADTFIITANPTCERVGMSCKRCKICDAESNITMISALGHRFVGNIDTIKAPTCLEHGTTSQFCDRCSLNIQTSIDSLGHQFSTVHVIDVPATCELEGINTRHCERCEEKCDTVITEPINHRWDKGHITTQPTDTTWGILTHYCQNIGCTSLDTTLLDKLVSLYKDEQGKSFDIKLEGYCGGDEESLRYISNPNAGVPTEYKMVFSEEAKKQGFLDIDWTPTPTDEQLPFTIPDNCKEGKYTAHVIFRNEDTIQSPAIPVEFVVNLSQDFTVAIFRDVISIIKNDSFQYQAFQWYHNDELLEGATLPYYQEKGGLTGSYFVIINPGTANEIRTCTRDNWFNPLNKNRDVILTPNLVKEGTTVKLYNFDKDNHTLTLINEYGVILYETTFEGDEYSISAQQLVSGQYIIDVDGIRAKMIKQ